MNAWGAVIIAIGCGVLWWAVKHSGSLGSGLVTTGTNVANNAGVFSDKPGVPKPGVGNNTGQPDFNLWGDLTSLF